ncbi:MAG: rhomboid family intramembrane serine protease [Planctomycetota bacterium]
MGIYDRPYYREERQPSFGLRQPTTFVAILIGLNVAIWLIEGLVLDRNARGWTVLGEVLTLRAGDLLRPWLWWRFVTYSFVHAPGVGHIFGNMLGLFFFGRPIEERYGRWEFLRLYVLFVAAGGIFWSLVALLEGAPNSALVGASGGVAGVVILFALNFPHATVLFMFLIPMPAWLIGVGLVAYDALGALGFQKSPDASNVAFIVHLTGAALAFVYYRLHWNLGAWIPGRSEHTGGRLQWPRWLRWPRPRLRVHRPDPEDSDREPPEDNLSAEVDRILEKITRSGEASLTAKERRKLEAASREYQRRREQ